MFSTGRTKNRIATLTATVFLFPLTACTRDQLSLTVAHAAASATQMVAETAPLADPPPAPRKVLVAERLLPEPLPEPLLDVRRANEEMYRALPSCYAYMLRRPRSQREVAVQARLDQADRMSAALDSDTFNVDLVGDHANILSLDFPVVWPAAPAYSEKVSAVIVGYLSVPQIRDYLCDSGFSEVKLSAHGLNDGRTHVLWTARVTTEGLITVKPDGKRELLDAELSK